MERPQRGKAKRLTAASVKYPNGIRETYIVVVVAPVAIAKAKRITLIIVSRVSLRGI